MSPNAGQCKITAIRLGNLTVDSANLLYGRERGEIVVVPVWGAAVESGDKRILVDTGVRNPAWVAERNLGSCTQSEQETMVGALAKIGWRCEDVDIVVNTHLHFDHCGHNSAFPQAQLVVARSEWESAFQPIPDQAVLYEEHEWLLPPLDQSAYTLIDEDDVEIAPGVRVMQTPGHSVGHEVVLVTTPEGTVCVAGDAVNIAENFVVGRPGGIVWDLELAIQSLEKIRSSADRILMAHDGRVADFMTSGFPAIPTLDARVDGCC